jgi:hypothetical protein
MSPVISRLVKWQKNEGTSDQMRVQRGDSSIVMSTRMTFNFDKLMLTVVRTEQVGWCKRTRDY